MPDIALISGSTSTTSRTAAILQDMQRQLTARGLTTAMISVLDFPAEDLLYARYDSPVFAHAKSQIASAGGIVVATPIYKASYSGALKTLLDILPQLALRGKTVLPVATGGSLAHLLAIDYALKPVLSALGATDLLQGIYAVDDQAKVSPTGELWLSDDLRARVDASLVQLIATVKAESAGGGK
jgi:FMN reductase